METWGIWLNNKSPCISDPLRLFKEDTQLNGVNLVISTSVDQGERCIGPAEVNPPDKSFVWNPFNLVCPLFCELVDQQISQPRFSVVFIIVYNLKRRRLKTGLDTVQYLDLRKSFTPCTSNQMKIQTRANNNKANLECSCVVSMNISVLITRFARSHTYSARYRNSRREPVTAIICLSHTPSLGGKLRRNIYVPPDRKGEDIP